ncbi:MAG: DUF4410 domain-containing protein [Alphaproteobacteria bacterium]|nr:DUF4410 domain-containing protein [Alphaproteobacteria bacterium]
MKSFTIISGLLLLLALAGCQTTGAEETDNISEGTSSAPTTTKAQPNVAAIPGYSPVDGEKFTYILVSPTKEIPTKQYKILKETIENGLREAGKLAENGASAKQVEVLFTNYRMRSPGVRFSVGTLAGKDKIETMVHIKNSGNGEILHSQFFRTGSARAWTGIGKVLTKHANKVVAYVVRGKGNKRKRAN